MGKRYYCEYCNRAFQDNLYARKKHLNSLTHIRKREDWYRNFKDKKTIYYENLNKKPCNKFIASGTCPFGDHCKYRHFQPEDFIRLKNEVENTSEPPELPSGEQILRKWLSTRKRTSKGNLEKSEVEASSKPLLTLELEREQPLPPSLLPPPEGGWDFSCDDLAEWG